MAHHKSAVKRMRQSAKKKLYNRQNKKKMKEAVKSVRSATVYEDGMEKLRLVTKILDRISAKGVIHRNEAANRKSILSRYVKSLKVQS